MKNMLSVNYLSHVDFVKVLQWTLLEALNGSYFDQLAKFDADIKSTQEIHGFVPKKAYEEKRKFQREWSVYALYARHTCVDVETGEVYDCKTRHVP